MMVGCLRVGYLHSHLKRKNTLCCKGFAFGFWSTFGAVCFGFWWGLFGIVFFGGAFRFWERFKFWFCVLCGNLFGAFLYCFCCTFFSTIISTFLHSSCLFSWPKSVSTFFRFVPIRWVNFTKCIFRFSCILQQLMFVQLVQVCFAKPLAKQNRQSRLTRKYGILSFQDMKSTSLMAKFATFIGVPRGFPGGVSAGGRPAARSEEPSSAQLATAWGGEDLVRNEWKLVRGFHV